MIKLKAPEGYKYRDSRNNKEYSEVITDDRNKKYFTLVPNTTEYTTEVLS